jgi:hypothetical protein
MWSGSSGYGKGPVAGSCEHGNEPSGTIKYNIVLQHPVALVITNILWISLRCNNLFTLMCIRCYLETHVSATPIIRCYTLVLSLDYEL